MASDSIYTVNEISTGLYKDKGSKFIAVVAPVETESEIKEKIEDIKKQYHDARHHCYAYALGKNHDIYRINDDSEPSGTAGRPIYGQIQSFNLTNVLIVVVRYFGGTKLGVRGLINAYKGAAKDAVEKNKIVEKFLVSRFRVYFDYPEMNNVMRIIKEYNLEQFNHDFSQTCSLDFDVRQSFEKDVIDAFSSLINIKVSKIE